MLPRCLWTWTRGVCACAAARRRRADWLPSCCRTMALWRRSALRPLQQQQQQQQKISWVFKLRKYFCAKEITDALFVWADPFGIWMPRAGWRADSWAPRFASASRLHLQLLLVLSVAKRPLLLLELLHWQLLRQPLLPPRPPTSCCCCSEIRQVWK